MRLIVLVLAILTAACHHEPMEWVGIPDGPRTCTGDDYGKITCVSGNAAYLCVVDRRVNKIVCARLTPFSAEERRP